MANTNIVYHIESIIEMQIVCLVVIAFFFEPYKKGSTLEYDL